MLDGTFKKLLHILESDNPPELRCAALRVLGALGLREDEVARVLCKLIDDKESTVRLDALATAGRLRIDQALPQLLERISGGGEEAEAAAQAAAQLGAKGTKALQDLMGQVAPGLRRRIAGALGAGGTSSAGAAAVHVLLDTDPGVVDAAVRSLTSEIPTMTAGQKRALADHVLESLGGKKGLLLPTGSAAAFLRLLAALGDARGEQVFWRYIEKKNAVELRVAALQALGTLPPPKGMDQIRLLIDSAGDADFRVAAPALMLLKSIPVTGKASKDWLVLLDAHDVAVRRFGIEKLGDQDSAIVAAALLQNANHPDRGLSNLAIGALGKLKHGREALARSLLEAPNPDAAWNLAKAQASIAAKHASASLEKIFSQACAYLDQNDRRADALFFLLREVDARGLRDQLEERALALRKKKDYGKAIVYFRLLARDPACGESTRFELACCGLKLSEHDLGNDARAADPCLEQFARLIRSHETSPLDRLKPAKWLEPEDLFYLGFHFIEKDHQDRDFGAEVLRLLLKRSPKSKLAKDAKTKLRRAGVVGGG
jgi:HEAT repeat protein